MSFAGIREGVNVMAVAKKINSYALETEGEAQRLERQSALPVYSVASELAGLRLPRGARVLDAGCGTGIVSRYLVNRFDDCVVEGCDFSDLRLKQGAGLSRTERERSIRFFRAPVEETGLPSVSLDAVVCRFVFQHLGDQKAAAREFHRVLKPQGQACVIDADGFIYNLFPASKKLQGFLNTLREKLPLDFFIGRKLPDLFVSAGFSSVSWNIQIMNFETLEEKAAEADLNRERFAFALPVFSKVLGSQAKAETFAALYLEEMMNPSAVLFYNKFIVTAVK